MAANNALEMIYDNLLVNAIVVLTPDGKQRNSIRKYLHHPFTIMIVCKTAIEINKLNPTNIKHIWKTSFRTDANVLNF